MWQLFITAGLLWVVGTIIIHVGWWVADKTAVVPMGAVLIGIGAALQYMSVLAIVTR